MKTFEQYIREAVDFRLGGKTKKGMQYIYFPKDRKGLRDIIKKLVVERSNEGDFNDIDTSDIKIMDSLFKDNNTFNGDITGWNVSGVKSMYRIFFNATSFNQPIGNWVVSNVEEMGGMFAYATSFNQDLSKWNLTEKETIGMFNDCPIKDEYKPKMK
jgi:hypothetical protein